jgi:hypothetical protein
MEGHVIGKVGVRLSNDMIEISDPFVCEIIAPQMPVAQ